MAKHVDAKEPTWQDKYKIGALMSRILRHANGELEMTATQLKAAQIFLGKTVPDLARTENENKMSGKLTVEIVKFGT